MCICKRFLLIPLLITSLVLVGCMLIVVKEPKRTVVASEWFRSGCYILEGDTLMMHTQPMSPVLGGTVVGGVVAGVGGAAAGGILGLVHEFFTRDTKPVQCDLVVGGDETER